MGFGIGVTSSGMGPRGALEHFSSEEEGQGKVFDRGIVGRMLAFLKPYRLQMVIALVAMLVASALTLLVPYLLKVAVDQYISSGDLQGLQRISLYTAAALSGCTSHPLFNSTCFRGWGSTPLPICGMSFFTICKNYPSVITIRILSGSRYRG